MLSFIVLDIETTGFSIGFDRIIELAMYKYIDGQIVSSWHSLFNPQVAIPARIQELTGITEEMVTFAPTVWEKDNDIKAFLEDLPIVAHNLDFDIGFLGKTFPNLDFSSRNLWDTVLLASILWPTYPSYSLEYLCEKQGIVLKGHHRAEADALATGQLMLQISEGFGKMPLETLSFFIALAEKFDSNLHSYFEFIARHKVKKFPDGPLSNIDKKHENSGLFQSLAVKSSKYTAEEGFLEKVFSLDGLLAQHLTTYNYRFQQEDLATSIFRAFEQDNFLLAEAGTGTGKSLAYLVPAVYWALISQKKVVIATHTINLQQQLWSKDLPLLKEVLPEFNAVLLKGRANYLCRRRWLSFVSLTENWADDEIRFSLRILVWLQGTYQGDKEELSLRGRERDLWSHIHSESESCLGFNCSHQQDCFFVKARKEAEEAQIIIVNHSLVLADMRTDNKVLPSHQYLVLDEAHHLENVAANHLGDNLNNFAITRFLKHLNNPVPDKAFMGFLKGPTFRISLWADIMEPEEYETFKVVLNEALEMVALSIDAVTELFKLINGPFFNKEVTDEGGVITLRIKPHHHGSELWQYISSAANNLHWRLSSLKGNFVRILRLFEAYVDAHGFLTTDILKDLEGFIQKLEDNLEFIKRFFEIQADGTVYWVEWEKRDYGMVCNLRIAPIEVNELLKEGIFSQKKSVIMTSATLTVQDSFEHFKKRNGLDLIPSDKIIEKVVPSPFNYEEQALLGICGDGFHNPQGELDRERMAKVLVEATIAAKGRSLILFTSHSLLREIYNLIKEPLEAKNIFPLGHGIDGSRAGILDLFRSNPSKFVILGANSFWEGVDLPGDHLVNLIITKLPFDAPNIPAIEARMEAIEAKSMNSFRHYSLPQAIIRLKQGVGRLIRTEKDYGVVTILDNRLIDKSYGKAFLKSLPYSYHVRWSSEMISNQISSWVAKKDIEKLV